MPFNPVRISFLEFAMLRFPLEPVRSRARSQIARRANDRGYYRENSKALLAIARSLQPALRKEIYRILMLVNDHTKWFVFSLCANEPTQSGDELLATLLESSSSQDLERYFHDIHEVATERRGRIATVLVRKLINEGGGAALISAQIYNKSLKLGLENEITSSIREFVATGGLRRLLSQARQCLGRMSSSTDSDESAKALSAMKYCGDDAVPLLAELEAEYHRFPRNDVRFHLGEAALASLAAIGSPLAEQAIAASKSRQAAETAQNEADVRPWTSKNDAEILSVLEPLCEAYARSDSTAVGNLEPAAYLIGKALDLRGGIAEMKRVFLMIQGRPGSRTLEMHWGGIGQWRS